MTTDGAPEQVVRDFLNAVNDRDYSALSDVLSESMTWIDPSLPEKEVHGSDGFETMLREIVVGFPDFHIEVLDIVADENVVMAELLYTGTHAGEFFGLPPTGREIEFQGVEKYQIESGDIERGRVYFSDAELKEQLGLTFPEVIGQLPKLALGKLQTVS